MRTPDTAGAAKLCHISSLCRRPDDAPRAGPSGGAPKLRVRITNAASGSVRLDTRFLLDFLPGLAAFVPQVCMPPSLPPYVY